MAGHGLALLVIVRAVLAAEAGPAGIPMQIEIEGPTVFSADELSKALMARLPADAPPGTLRLVAQPDGSIELSWQRRRRVVDTGEDRGPAAARVVALLAADLLLPLGLPPTAEAHLAPSASPSPTQQSAAPSTSAAPHDSTVRLTADYLMWSGARGGPLLKGAELAARVEGQRLSFRASAGHLSGAGNRLVDLTAWPMHLGVGVLGRFCALFANLVMAPYRMDGPVQVTRVLAGLGIEAQGRIPLLAGFSLDASAGFEGYLNRRAELWADSGQLIFAMPRSAFRFAMGLSWGNAR